MVQQSHESLTSFRKVEASSSRKFGVTVGLILVAIGQWPLVRHGHGVHGWLIAAGGILLALGIVRPGWLDPLNAAWFKLADLMARITNPIVMTAMFVVAVIPTGLVMRWSGKDPLRLRRLPEADTYWIEKSQPASALKNQF